MPGAAELNEAVRKGIAMTLDPEAFVEPSRGYSEVAAAQAREDALNTADAVIDVIRAVDGNVPLPTGPCAVKLASLARHAQEHCSPTGHPLDWAAVKALLADPEVEEYMGRLEAAALLPVDYHGPPLDEPARAKTRAGGAALARPKPRGVAMAEKAEKGITVEFTDDQAQLCLTALEWYAEDRRKVARRRDRREGGRHVENALSGFFEMANETRLVIRRCFWARRDAERQPQVEGAVQ